MTTAKKFFNFYNILRNQQLNTPIQIYMSTLTAGEDFDSFAKNYTSTNLNPVTVYGYVRELSPETAFWKQYGLYQTGMLEIICEKQSEQYFALASRVVVGGVDYQVYREGTGNKTLITERPGQLLRVVLTRAS